jgi:xanthine dehydrogenase accessory factor
MTPEVLAALLAARDMTGGAVLATRLADGTQLVLPDAAAEPALREAATAALANDQSHIATIGPQRWFLHVHAPAHRLLIVGAVHIAQALAPLAALTGLAVTVIDPRRGFASADRFPGLTLITAWPDEALLALAPDRRTAVVALSHDPKLDDPALDVALRGESFFVGALGSRKSHAARLARLAPLGHGPDALARIRGPVGLPIGGVTASEIGISILAEIIAARRGSALAAR